MTIIIIQFVKDNGLPIVCVATRTCRYDTERRSRRVKQFMSYSFSCCQENESYLNSVFPKVIPMPSFEMCGYPHILTEKAFTFCKLNLKTLTTFSKNGKLLVDI